MLDIKNESITICFAFALNCHESQIFMLSVWLVVKINYLTIEEIIGSFKKMSNEGGSNTKILLLKKIRMRLRSFSQFVFLYIQNSFPIF